jgi:Glycosyl hydrolases family 2, sugar binding domain/Glycosyl hydrolases family 2, TIM barrel domain/Glycosyl hydrolases family 2
MTESSSNDFTVKSWHALCPTALPCFLPSVLVVAVIAVVASGHDASETTHASDVVDLAGKWELALDPDDIGVRDNWFQPDVAAPYSLSARLPGSLEADRIGNPVTVDTPWTGSILGDGEFFKSPRYEPYRQPGHVKIPFALQPETWYRGPAWRRRTITIPAAWRDKHITLELERCHWMTHVWLDGVDVGSGEALSVPHRFDLTGKALPGKHQLVIRVDNRLVIDVGANSHSVTDHTQGNWNGIVGDIRLVATPNVWIDRLEVYPDASRRLAKIVVFLGNTSGHAAAGRLRVTTTPVQVAEKTLPQNVTVGHVAASGNEQVEITCPLGDTVRLWDEFSPQLYHLSADWLPDDEQLAGHTASTQFGVRDVGVDGTQITLNGRKLFLRGTLECNVFPLTGHPPTDVAGWKKVFAACKAYGLNHVRFHSHCPPEAALAAADELGVYLQVECGSWANWSTSIGDGKPVDQFLYREADRILAEYGNHPSFLLMAYGNEPRGPERGAKYLSPWVSHFRQQDSRRLYTAGAGWPIIQEDQFHVTPQPRIYHWGHGPLARINAHAPETTTDYRGFVAATARPAIAHETGQWCVYPNFSEMHKYTGYLKPHNFEIFRDFLAAEGLEDQAHDFLMASGKLQVLCYKEEIESALRTPGLAGFQLLGLSDFSGQGTALVGVLDAFWDPKPYVDAAEFRRFCGPLVPLARLPKRYFVDDETLDAEVDVANYGPLDLAHKSVQWKLTPGDGSRPIAQGVLEVTAPTGSLTRAGQISVPLASCRCPAKLRLSVQIAGTDAENSWDLWVYPATPPAEAPDDVYVCSQLDDAALERLSRGEKVWLMLPPQQVATNRKLDFSSIFWNTAWTNHQPPHTLGILCDPRHPLFAQFPTEAHSNWQWWQLVHGAATMELDGPLANVKPLVQVVPDWFDPKKLALAFEARVGGGSLMITSMDLSSNLTERHVARQFRTSLLNYMAGDNFRPSQQLTVEDLQTLIQSPAR